MSYGKKSICVGFGNPATYFYIKNSGSVVIGAWEKYLELSLLDSGLYKSAWYEYSKLDLKLKGKNFTEVFRYKEGLERLEDLQPIFYTRKEMIEIGVKENNISFLNDMIFFKVLRDYEKILKIAFREFQIEVIEWLKTKGVNIGVEYANFACEIGNVEMLEYLAKMRVFPEKNSIKKVLKCQHEKEKCYSREYSMYINNNVCKYSCIKVETLEYFFNNLGNRLKRQCICLYDKCNSKNPLCNKSIQPLLIKSITYGRQDIIDWLFSHGYKPRYDYLWDRKIAYIYNTKKLNKYLKHAIWFAENERMTDEMKKEMMGTMEKLIKFNNIELLELYEKNGKIYGTKDANVVHEKGNIEILNWLRENRSVYPDLQTINKSITKKGLHTVKINEISYRTFCMYSITQESADSMLSKGSLELLTILDIYNIRPSKEIAEKLIEKARNNPDSKSVDQIIWLAKQGYC